MLQIIHDILHSLCTSHYCCVTVPVEESNMQPITIKSIKMHFSINYKIKVFLTLDDFI